MTLEQHVQRRPYLELIEEAVLHDVHVPPGETQVLKGVQAADPAELLILVDVNLLVVLLLDDQPIPDHDGGAIGHGGGEGGAMAVEGDVDQHNGDEQPQRQAAHQAGGVGGHGRLRRLPPCLGLHVLEFYDHFHRFHHFDLRFCDHFHWLHWCHRFGRGRDRRDRRDGRFDGGGFSGGSRPHPRPHPLLNLPHQQVEHLIHA